MNMVSSCQNGKGPGLNTQLLQELHGCYLCCMTHVLHVLQIRSGEREQALEVVCRDQCGILNWETSLLEFKKQASDFLRYFGA